MNALRFPSRSYAEARERFCHAAERAGLALSSHPIAAAGPAGEPLAIDVAERPAAGARATLVVSSGTHGVEGFFGSAVQLQFLLGAATSPAARSLNLVLVHALNPYGFAHACRVNEDGIDLNRNFVLPGEPYAGAHPLYAALDGLLNPATAPRGLDPFLLQAGASVARHGFRALKNAIAQGQYDFPHGLFYGGSAPSASAGVMAELAPRISAGVERVLHLDLHTGMGRRGEYALCVDLPVSSPRIARLGAELGRREVQGFDPAGTLYEMRGSLSRYLDRTTTHAEYDCVLAEFGTEPALAVLGALRFEQRVRRHAPDDAELVARARARMLEAFFPSDPAWRTRALGLAEQVLVRGLRALTQLR
jgi:Protein of unknown function (DUF2817)